MVSVFLFLTYSAFHDEFCHERVPQSPTLGERLHIPHSKKGMGFGEGGSWGEDAPDRGPGSQHPVSLSVGGPSAPGHQEHSLPE